MSNPAPFVTLRINGKVMEAICPLCLDVVLSLAVSLAEQGEPDLDDYFDWHMKARHRPKENNGHV